MSSSSTLDALVPILLELAKNRSPISQAIDVAIQVNSTVNSVKSDKAEYAGLGEDAIKLLYIIEAEWREKLNTLTGILGKISELAQKNAAMNDMQAFWNNDKDDLQCLREELQQLLPAFGIMSFTDLQTKSDERIKDMGDNTDIVIEQRDDETSDNSHGGQFLPGASNTTITGGEFNNVGRDYNMTSYHGKNIGANYGPMSEVGQCDDGTSDGSHGGEFLPGTSNTTITGGEFNNVGRDYNKMSYHGKNIGANYGTVSGQSVIGDSTTMTIKFPPT